VKVWIWRPTAWLPFVVSLAALAFVLGYAAAFGAVAHDAEHAPARFFQMLMLVQVALIAMFAARWLPRAPRSAALIVAAQILATSLPIATLVYVESRA
jgi:hypothetical protein